MMCLLPPRGVAREEVVNSFVSNFLLREGIIMHGEMSLAQLIPNCALLAPILTSLQSGLYLWELRGQPFRKFSAGSGHW